MEIKLKRLSIGNFKGIPQRTIEFQNPTIISGANATGKTTIFDAFTFLLFGKNSNGDEKFQMRPLNFDGSVVHNVEIILDGEFELIYGETSKTISLKKTTKEKWVKRRGSDVTELQGNETVYEIDGYPKTERDFKEYIASLIDEKAFKLITNPKAFVSLPWKEQRAILMSLISQQTDAEMARSMGGYLEIVGELEDHSPDDIQAKYKKALNELKKQQSELPVRIDEVHKQGNEAAAEMTSLRSELAELEQAVSGVSFEDYDTQIHDAEMEQMRLESELRKANSKFDSDQSEKKFASMEAIRKAEYAHTVASGDCAALAKSVDSHKSVIQAIKKEVAEAEFNLDKLSKEQMDETKLSCPVCGRRFTEKKIGKLKEDFYKHINDKMQFLRNVITEKKAEFQAASMRLDELDSELHQKKVALVNAETELKSAKVAYQEPVKVSFVDTEDYKSLAKQIADVIAIIDMLEKSKAEQAEAMKENAAKLARIQEIKERITAGETAIEWANKRIESLREEQQIVSQKAMDCEKMLNLVEKFIREKMNLISSQINDLFGGGVGFKLFDLQINGGLKETCECTINGVPYSSANNGHQIIAGLEIIKVLQVVYGVKAPIFVDNAEAVNTFNYPAMDCQMVYLRVTDDNELRVTTA